MAALPMLLILLLELSAPQAPADDLDLFLGTSGISDIDGKVWRRADLAGRAVLVDVWATWCAPCLAELPTLRRLRAEQGERVVILGLSLDTMPRRDFLSWLARHDVRWPQHFDGRGYSSPVATRLGLRSVPVSWLFGPDGRLVARDLRGEALVRAVRELTQPIR